MLVAPVVAILMRSLLLVRYSSCLLRNQFHWLWLNGILRPFAGVFASTSGKATNRPNTHVVIAEDLATEANAAQPSGREDAFLGNGHHLRFTGHELDSAGGTACIAATRMKLIHLGFVLQRQHEPFSLRHLKTSYAFNCQIRHVVILHSMRHELSTRSYAGNRILPFIIVTLP